MDINKDGFLATSYSKKDGHRTYACMDQKSLDALILYLTGKGGDSFPQDFRGLPVVHTDQIRVSIVDGLHIWGYKP